MVFGCDNPIETPKNTNVSSTEVISITINSETGSELTDNVKFTEKTILYAKSESIPENSAYVSWEIADNKGGSLKAEYVEKGIKKTLPMGGKKIPVGTKIAFTALPDKANYYEVESCELTP